MITDEKFEEQILELITNVRVALLADGWTEADVISNRSGFHLEGAMDFACNGSADEPPMILFGYLDPVDDNASIWSKEAAVLAHAYVETLREKGKFIAEALNPQGSDNSYWAETGVVVSRKPASLGKGFPGGTVG